MKRNNEKKDEEKTTITLSIGLRKRLRMFAAKENTDYEGVILKLLNWFENQLGIEIDKEEKVI